MRPPAGRMKRTTVSRVLSARKFHLTAVRAQTGWTTEPAPGDSPEEGDSQTVNSTFDISSRPDDFFGLKFACASDLGEFHAPLNPDAHTQLAAKVEPAAAAAAPT